MSLPRPRFHFTCPNWMNDPIPFWHAGQWHVFYQHNPHAPRWDTMHWGHAVSQDLLNWETLPIALGPDQPYDLDGGVWTGSVVAHNNQFYAFYTAVSDLRTTAQTQCVATSRDLVRWEKYAHNPLLVEVPQGFGPCWRDPCVFYDARENVWKMLVGSQRAGQGGALLLYEAEELFHWRYVGVSLLGDREETGFDFECPDLFPLGDRWVLLTSRGAVHWQVGDWDGRRFYPQRRGTCDGPPYSRETHEASPYYAAKSAVDGRGRRVLFSWLREMADIEGRDWSGALALPRELKLLNDGTLGMEPATEMNRLRHGHQRLEPIVVPALERREIPAWSGTQLEFTFRSDGRNAFRLVLRANDDHEGTAFAYDADRGTFDGMPTGGGPLEIRGFVDESIVEIFVNGRLCTTKRTYAPTSQARAFFEAGPHSVPLTWLHSWQPK